jgi:hypothetical protein
MGKRIQRSVIEPIRVGLSWDERWRGDDLGLIACWESGREMRATGGWYPTVPEGEVDTEPGAARADRGELLSLPWKGGVTKKLKVDVKYGTLMYLAMWQGLRGEDLDVDLDGEAALTCELTGQRVVFNRELPPELADWAGGAEEIEVEAEP